MIKTNCMRQDSLRILLLAFSCSLLVPVVTAQPRQVSHVSLDSEIKLLQDRLCRFRVIDTAVYFIETHLRIKPTYLMKAELISDSLKNPNHNSFLTIISGLAKCSLPNCLNTGPTINVFIKEYTACLKLLEPALSANTELTRDLFYYYHSAWNLFHHAKPDDWDFDENLLAIYHLQRSYIGLRVNSKITELRQQIKLDSVQSKLDSLVTEIENSKTIGKIRFDSLDTANARNKRLLDSLSTIQDRSRLIAPFFSRGKWLQKSQRLSPEDIRVLTKDKSIYKGKKALKKRLR
jgi:hypothetical protein